MQISECDVSEATEKIWLRFNERLLRFIRKRVGDDCVAEDLLQDVFVKIHRNIDSLKDGSRVDSWVFQVTRNAIIDHYRTRKESEELPDWLASPTPERETEDVQELSSCLVSLMSKLPDKYRTAVHLSDVAGRPQKEIAEAEGISLSGAKSRIQRGRGLLRELLMECCHCSSLDRGKYIGCSSGDGECDGC